MKFDKQPLILSRRLVLVYLSLVGGILLFVSFAPAGVGLKSSLSAFIYPVPDRPGDVSPTCTRPLFVGHYFGDFQSDYCRTKAGLVYTSSPGIEGIANLILHDLESGKTAGPFQNSYLSPALREAVIHLRSIFPTHGFLIDEFEYGIESGQIPLAVAEAELEKSLTRPSWYPPSFYVMTWVLFLPSTPVLSFVTILFCSLLLWLAAMRSITMRNPTWLLMVLSSYPFFYGVIRGNTGWILATPLIALFLTSQRSNRSGWAFLAVATCLKPQLALLFLIFLVRRQIGPAIKFICTSTLVNAIGAILFLNSFEELWQLSQRFFHTEIGSHGLRYDLESFGAKVSTTRDFGVLSSLLNNEGHLTVSRVLLLAASSVLIFRVLTQVQLSKLSSSTQACDFGGHQNFVVGLFIFTCVFASPSFLYSLSLCTVILLIVPLGWRERTALTVACLPLLIPSQISTRSGTEFVFSGDYLGQLTRSSVGALLSSFLLIILFFQTMLRKNLGSRQAVPISNQT